MFAGASVPDAGINGGTINNLALYNAVGILPAGGSLNITNLYGFKAGGALTAMNPTNAWGFHCSDIGADNYFEKSLTIGGDGKTTNSDIAIEIKSLKTIKLASFSTTEKNAISSPEGGMILFDSTLGKMCIYSDVSNAWETITSI